MRKFTPKDLRKLTVGLFLAVPFLSSLISTLHIVTFFGLGNLPWMAVVLAIAFEIGSIASLMTLAVLDRINRFAVWFIFVVLISMQMIGNVYYTYDFVSTMMASNAQWINNFVELIEVTTMQKLDPRTTKLVLSLLIGLPIPVVSLAFLKSVADYLRQDTSIPEAQAQDQPVLADEPQEEPAPQIVQGPMDVTVTGRVGIIQQPTLNSGYITPSDSTLKIEVPMESGDPVILVPDDTVLYPVEESNVENFEVIEPVLEPVIQEPIPHEVVLQEEIPADDIYDDGGEPDETFFNDDTEEDEYDGFVGPTEDEKKSS